MHFLSVFRKQATLVAAISLLCLLGVVSANGQTETLSPQEREKLGGELQMLLDQGPPNAKETGEVAVALPSLAAATVSSGSRTLYSVIVHTDDPSALRKNGIIPNSVFDDFLTAHVTQKQLRTLAQTAAVTRVGTSTQLQSHNDEAAREVGARILNSGAVNGTSYKGQGVISCIIDTGIDYDHGDFYRADGTTRLLRIWDQPDANDSTGTGHPDSFTYGAEYTESEINTGNVSQKDADGHGTHVAGTMASSGNALVLDGTQSEPEHRGMAPKSDIVIVKSDLGSAEIIDGMTYCTGVAADQGKPVVINLSLGGHDAPHDGTSQTAQAIDQITGPGTIVVASAGNEGNQSIHTSGTIGSSNTSTESWTVGEYTPTSGTVNDYFATTFWIEGTNSLRTIVTSPSGLKDTLNTVKNTSEFKDTADGAIYMESDVSSDNGDRYLDVQVFDNTAGQEPLQGTWDITIANNGSSSTTYHGWTWGNTVPGNFDNGDGKRSIGSPGTASNAITVGSYVHRWRWSNKDDSNFGYTGLRTDERDDISPFSSRGPLRNGTQKPDIAAPGQGMVSALSLDKPNPSSNRIMKGGKHRLLQGTSMSSPTVAGAVALLLQEDASLTPADIKNYLTNSATVDDFVKTYGSSPNPRFGAGKLNILAAMTDLLGGSTNRSILSYEDPWTTIHDQTVGGSGVDKIALRFTPKHDGFMTGVLFNLGSAAAHSANTSLNVEVWSDDGSGAPDTKKGAVQVSPNQLKDFSPTAVSLLPSSVTVSAGENYHLVLYPNTSSKEIKIGYETAGSASGRSNVFDESSWSSLGGDAIIRPEITRTTGVSGRLPVEVAAFSGTSNRAQTTLTWSTASETNNAGFYLQHKAPGASTFARTAYIEGQGTTRETHTYRHTLDDLAPGTHTFRLRQMDIDGTMHPGPTTTVTVKMQAAYDVTPVSPNPLRGRGSASVTVRRAQPVTAAVYNVLGQRVATLHDGPLPAQTPTPLRLGSALSSGVYFLRVEGESFAVTRKFVRLE